MSELQRWILFLVCVLVALVAVVEVSGRSEAMAPPSLMLAEECRQTCDLARMPVLSWAPSNVGNEDGTCVCGAAGLWAQGR